MTTIKTLSIATITALAMASCNSATEKKAEEKTDTVSVTKPVTETKVDVSGNYVTADYQKRAEGFDWVAVSVKNTGDNEISVSIRSRVDKKKATCTFNAIAQKKSDNVYQTSLDGKNILFSFNNEKISIATEKSDDSSLLNYYCSGGGSLAGEYTKSNEPLDEKQIDKKAFKASTAPGKF